MATLSRSTTGHLQPIGALNGRIESLDGLRGAAAFVVLAHHCCRAYFSAFSLDPDGNTINRIADRAGHSAVVLFFVLSGFVLMRAYGEYPLNNIGLFLCNRVARLYPALVASIALSSAVFLFVAPTSRPELGYWLDVTHEFRPNARNLVGSLLLLNKNSGDVGLNRVIWSLCYEMRFSVLFPIVAYAMIKKPIYVACTVSLAYAISKIWLTYRGFNAHIILGFSWTNCLLITVMYMGVFVAGMGLAKVSHYLPVLSPKYSNMLVVTAMVTMALAWNEVALTIASGFLIYAALVQGPSRELLESLPLQWAGRISYSLYLFHMIIMYYSVYLLFPEVSFSIVMSFTVILSILLAYGSYRFIELPGVRLGKFASRQIAPKN